MVIADDLTILGLNPYIFFAILGLFCAVAVYFFLILREGFGLKIPSVIAFGSFLGLIVGARVFSYLAGRLYFLETGKEIYGGLVFYGGLLGFVLVYIMLQKITLGALNSSLLDAGAVVIPLFHAFGRLGCTFSGCCYGIHTEHFGLMYKGLGLRFPIQPVGSLLEFLIFGILFAFALKRKFKGKLLPIYLTLYPIFRFILEFLRGDEVRGSLFGLSFSQIISVLLFLAMIYTDKKIFTTKEK